MTHVTALKIGGTVAATQIILAIGFGLYSRDIENGFYPALTAVFTGGCAYLATCYVTDSRATHQVGYGGGAVP
jgi:hypothetical protein